MSPLRCGVALGKPCLALASLACSHLLLFSRRALLSSAPKISKVARVEPGIPKHSVPHKLITNAVS